MRALICKLLNGYGKEGRLVYRMLIARVSLDSLLRRGVCITWIALFISVLFWEDPLPYNLFFLIFFVITSVSAFLRGRKTPSRPSRMHMIYLFFLMAADFVFSRVNPLIGRYVSVLTFPIVALDEFKIFFRELRGVLERVQW